MANHLRSSFDVYPEMKTCEIPPVTAVIRDPGRLNYPVLESIQEEGTVSIPAYPRFSSLWAKLLTLQNPATA